jgi:hypothetical protein
MRLLFVICTGLILASCKSLQAPVPEELIQDLPPVDQKKSTLSMPVEIDLSPYFKDIEKSIPKSFSGKEEQCTGVSYSYKFNRQPIHFEGKGRGLYYEIDGKYSLKLNYCPECTFLINSDGNCIVPRIYASCGVGEPMRRATVGYITDVEVSKDLNLKSKTSIAKFETPDACEITVFKYDATDQLRKEVTAVLKDLEKEIDKSISEVDIKSEIKEVWDLMSNPMDMEGYGYLNFHPDKIALGEIVFKDKKALINVHMSFYPEITTIAEPLKIKPLPSLSDIKQQDGFDIQMQFNSGYDSLNAILNKQLSGYKIELGKNTILFDSVSVQGAQGKKLNLKVKFSGDKKGTLYLVGSPVFDQMSQIISFPDLEFDLESKNLLLKSAKWMFSYKITDVIREKAVVDLKPHLEEARKALSKELNTEITKGVFLKGKTDKIEVAGIYPGENALIIRIDLTGSLMVKM